MRVIIRIGLFLFLVLLLTSALSIAQEEVPERPTGNIAYSILINDTPTFELRLYNLVDETSIRLSPEDDDPLRDAPFSFSPDGNRLALRSDNRLAFINVDGSDFFVTQINNVFSLTWSSDGTKVAFLRIQPRTSPLYVMNVYDVDTQALTVYDGNLVISQYSSPTWSADGTRIIFSGALGENLMPEIFSIDADFDDATLINLTNTSSVGETSPITSPDGAYISYKLKPFDTFTQGDFWVMDANGGNQRLISENIPMSVDEAPYHWSPDSQWVIMEKVNNGLFAINILTGETKEFEGDVSAWSPDGQWLAFTRRNRANVSNMYVIPVSALSSRAPMARSERLIIENVLGNTTIAWQPDPTITFETTEQPTEIALSGTLEAGERIQWQFAGASGDSIVIIAESADFDTYLELYDADNVLIAENDDYKNTNSRIAITLTADSTYTLVIRAYYGDMQGAYQLMVQGNVGNMVLSGAFVSSQSIPQASVVVELPTATPTPSPTLTPTPSATPTPTPTLTPTPTPGFDRSQCPANLPPRLSVGARGRVLPGLPNVVYDQPRSTGIVLGEVPGGVIFRVLDGPVCNEGAVWWQIEYRTIIGWTTEGTDGQYSLEPR